MMQGDDECNVQDSSIRKASSTSSYGETAGLKTSSNNHNSDFQLGSRSKDSQEDISHQASDEVTSKCSPSYVCGLIKEQAINTYKQINHPFYFVLFNLSMIFQAVVAITYYVYFFQPNYYLYNSSGMPPVWGATIGSICSAIVGSALGPLPPGIITREFCIGVIFWQFEVCFFSLIAAVSLAAQRDFNGMVWTFIAMFASCANGVFLLWYAREVESKMKYEASVESQGHLELKAITLEVDNDFEAGGGASCGSGNTPAGRGNDRGGESEESMHEKATLNPSTDDSKSWKQTLSSIGIYAVRTLLWIVLFVFMIIPAGFGVGEAMTAHEAAMYPMPGKQYRVSATYNGTEPMVPMHLYCTGTSKGQRPTILFQADYGTSGFSFFGMQQTLSSLGWRSCSYDRFGYGWSNMAPQGTASPINLAHNLQDLLKLAGEAQGSNGVILVGHGQGGEMMQIYASYFPDQVSGLVLLDTYPSLPRLLQTSDVENLLKTKDKCGDYNIGRCMDTVALIRPYNDYVNDQEILHGNAFEPSNERDRWMSTINNGKLWAAMYSDYCIDMRTEPYRYTDFLTAAGDVGGIQYQWPVKWLSLPPSAPALIVSAEDSITKGDHANLFYRQVQLYNSTLSPTGKSKWIVCKGCKHTFPRDSNYDWTAKQIDGYFAHFY